LNLNNGANPTTLTLAAGGLLFTGSNDYTITGGTILSGLAASDKEGASYDLVIQQYGTGNLTIGAIIADNGAKSALTKAGPGTLTLTGANTYTGATYIDGGILSLAYNNFGDTYGIALNGGALQVSGPANWVGSYNNPIFDGGAGATIDVIDGGTLTLGPIYTYGQGYFGSEFVADGGLTVNSSDASGGTLVLNSTNYFIGGLNIVGGTVRLSGADSLGGIAAPVDYVTFGSAAIEDLQLNGNNAYVTGLSSASTNATVENGNGANNNVVLTIANGDNETYAGIFANTLSTGSGNLGLLKIGAGTLNLTNANSTYSGATEIDGGILNVASLAVGGGDSSIGASSNAASNLVFGGGTLQYTGAAAQSTDRLFTLGDTAVGGNTGAIDASGSGSSATLTFSNGGAIAFGNTAFAHTLTLTGSNTGNNTFSPVIGDSNLPTSLNKTGPGTWVLTAINTYTGPTKVTGGTLIVTGALSGSIGTSVTNATLAGTGSIANAVTIGNGLGSTGSAIISPGTSGATGTLTTGPLALNSDGEYAFSLNSTGGGAGSGADELIAASLSLNSNAHFTFADIATSPAALTPGTAFVAIQTTGAIIGTFANLPNGYEFISGPNAYQAAYTTDELTLTVVAVPEPGTWAMILSSLGFLTTYQRMRRRRQ
jgi:fibronectin-binding autotransporter adhesin